MGTQRAQTRLDASDARIAHARILDEHDSNGQWNGFGCNEQRRSAPDFTSLCFQHQRLISVGIIGIARIGNARASRLVNGALRLSDSYRDDHSPSKQGLDETVEKQERFDGENARLSPPHDSGNILREPFTEVMIGRRGKSQDRTIAGGVRSCKILALNGGCSRCIPHHASSDNAEDAKER